MAERSFPAPQVAAFGGTRVIASPFQFALTDDDNLQIVSANSLAGVVLAIQGRKLNSAGKIEPFAFSHTPNTDRSTKTQNYQLGAGALLNLTIFASSGTPMIGQTYVSARMIRGLSAATILLGGLLGGYVTAAQPQTYPGSIIQSSIEGGGYYRAIVGTNPAAGVDIAETVPAGARWELVTLRAHFVASGVAGNRTPELTLISGGVAYGAFGPAAAVIAGFNGKFNWGAGLPLMASNPASDAMIPIPIGMVLPAGAQITTSTSGLLGGDDWDAPSYTVREWLEVQS